MNLDFNGDGVITVEEAFSVYDEEYCNKISKSRIDAIVEAINNNDTMAIYKMFSNKAKKNVDLEKGIKELCDIFETKISPQYDTLNHNVRKDLSDGKMHVSYRTSFYIDYKSC